MGNVVINGGIIDVHTISDCEEIIVGNDYLATIQEHFGTVLLQIHTKESGGPQWIGDWWSECYQCKVETIDEAKATLMIYLENQKIA